VPTTRPRHQITETPEVARAIDLAARRWPGESRAQLLRRVIGAGGAALEDDRLTEVERRRAVLAAIAGKYDDAFPPGHLADLRRDWPE
jgi:hypothetical protein